MLTSDYIYQQLPVAIRPFFKIAMADIAEDYAHLLDNLVEAIHIISRYAHLNKTINLVVASNPFELQLSTATLSVQLSLEAVQYYIENFVFLDLNKMQHLPDSLQRAAHLEELTHVLMNVKDEHLVSVMVAEMLPDVRWQNGQYVFL